MYVCARYRIKDIIGTYVCARYRIKDIIGTYVCARYRIKDIIGMCVLDTPTTEWGISDMCTVPAF
jgi:hypothetical protein